MSDKEREARPWDLLNPHIHRASQKVRKERMDICNLCQHFISLTKQCSKCGCIMPLKTKLANASCPLNKWEITGEYEEQDYE